MPRYDVKCEGCGHAYEASAPMKDGPPKDCPKCEKPLLKPVISPVIFHSHLSPMHPRAKRGRGY